MKDLRALIDEREIADAIARDRFGRKEHQTMSQWKTQIKENLELDQGKLVVTYPDGSKTVELEVQNFAHDGPHALARNAAEAKPSVKCRPAGNDALDVENAHIREAIGSGYWDADEMEVEVQELCLDILVKGAAFLLCYPDIDKDGQPRRDYPGHIRLDPMGCYPTFFRRNLIDLLYVEEIPARTVASVWPKLGFTYDVRNSDIAEVVTLYTEEFIYSCLYATDRLGKQSGQAYHLEKSRNKTGVLNVAWCKWPAADPQRFETMLDQVRRRLARFNQTQGIIIDHSDRTAYGERVFEGGPPLQDERGPDGTIITDQGGKVYYLAPQALNPALPHIRDGLERSIRNTVAHPMAMSGDTGKLNIGSAALMDSLMGEPAAVTRTLHRLLGILRQRAIDICYRIDEQYLNFPKPLRFPVKTHKEYTPKAQIRGRYQNEVVYGSHGMARGNDMILDLQLATTEIIPKSQVRRKYPDLVDSLDAEREIEMEQSRRIFFQSQLARMSPMAHMKFHKSLKSGLDSDEAIEKLMQEPEAQAPALPVPGAPGPAPAPMSPEEEALALEKGGVPGEAPLFDIEAPVQPLPQVFVGT